MDFSWILLALFLIALISGMRKALTRSVLKNALRLGSVVVAFLITFGLQLGGVFQNSVAEVVKMFNLAAMLPGLEGVADIIGAFATTIAVPLVFFVPFFLIMWVLRIIIHFVVKIIDNAAAKKTAAPTAEPVSEPVEEPANEPVAEAVADEPVADEPKADTDEAASEEVAVDEAEQGEPDADSVAQDASDEAEKIVETDEAAAEEPAEEKVEEPVVEEKAETVDPVVEEKAEPTPEKPKKAKKKMKTGLYEECGWKRAISVATGAISGLLILAVMLMPMFYFMSIVTTATDSIEGSDADDSQIYMMVDIVDEYIASPYENSFVYSFYNAIGLTDLMNYTAKVGGKIELSTGTIYADDVLKGLISHGISAAAQITSAKSECNDVKNDVNAIISDPLVSSIVSDVAMQIIAGIELEEASEEDLISGLINNFIDYYKNADKQTISSDIQAIGQTVGVLAEERILAQLILSGELDLGAMLENEETLGNVVEAISGLSAFGPTIEGAFELGIEILGETLQIPANDAEVYENFLDDLLSKMVKADNTKFDQNTIKYYVYNCAQQGVKVSASNGIKGHSTFVAYVAHWEKVQAAFANASEDKSYGYFTIEINGQWYVYDKNTKDIIIYNGQEEYKDKISPVAGLINALALSSSTKEIDRDKLFSILTSYVASSNDATSVALANKILNKDSFTSDAVTIEKMLAATNFSDWTAEEKAQDSRLCVSIITKLLGLMDALGGTGSEAEGLGAAMDMIDQFQLLGETMDMMKQTSCIGNLPSLLIEGIVKNEMFTDFMKPSIAFQINNIVENNDKTYAECMNQIAGILKWAISSLGGVN